MQVPNRLHARVEKSKVVDYLLSPTHRHGRAKWRLFSRLGYSPRNWKRLAEDLRRHVRLQVIEQAETTVYGAKYVVRGRLRGPSGIVVDLVSVWIIPNGEHSPRLVTAYPGGRS